MSRRTTIGGGLLVASGLLLASLPALGFETVASAISSTSGPAAAAKDGYSETKTLTRVFDNEGQPLVVDERRVTVKVNRTQELRGRERIRVSWTGAHPSAARAANPFGEGGLAQEYPVVILQCRGLDDPDLPAAKRLSPDTCWTSTRMQRSQSVVPRVAIWQQDLHATAEDKQRQSGMRPWPSGEQCVDITSFATRLTPFRAANGTVYPACSAETMPPEAAVGAAFPPAEVAAFSDAKGAGEVKYEVRSNVENESLGCSDKVPCSLVVIPIMGLSCVDGADARECRQHGRFPAGSSNFANEGVDAAVSPVYWWARSNWRNRFSVPLTFALPPDACDVLDPRPPVGFYGSELLAQASLQWAPAYCLNKKRFKFQHSRMSDKAAFKLMENGEAVAAFVSGERERSGDDRVGYAPTGVSGFAVGYIVDRPENAGEFTDLRLTPRLLAKLLTQSYPASALGVGHKGMKGNPLSINLDPEFQALNPGLDTISREAAATVLSLSESSDVISTLTAYLAEDPEAMAFVDGTPDPWGMRVNPTYRGIDLPTDDWPLLDTYVPDVDQECLKANPAPYLGQVAAPVNTLRAIAEAVLDAWPNVQTRCDRPTPTDPWKLGRIDRQGMGARMMLGIVSLGDAERFGLRTARLQATGPAKPQSRFTAAGRVFTGPDPVSLAHAVRLAEQDETYEPFTISQTALRRKAKAYPGTMIVYTAARLSGMAKADARTVAEFIRIATTEGQRRGFGNGQLPGGYLPLSRTGATGPLLRSANQVAAAVLEQKAPADQDDDPSDDPSNGNGPGGDDDPDDPPFPDPSDPDEPSDAPSDDDVPSGSPSASPSAPDSAEAEPAPGSTPALGSTWAGRLLPILISVGLVASVVAGLARAFSRGGDH
ncbi:hypothetical protein [Nocardioides speluncae]|uniref:hypothetical protein n=1 Tax=Nocardioides speluncae TaxID=2670337 RepID=UPI000D69A2F5|nr:hypothetical protein [Nocardioides speluncae]